MNTKLRFTFKLVEQNQQLLIQNWIAQKHIKEWLHGDGLQNLLEDLERSFKGTSWGQHWIAYDNDIPFAYLLTSEEGKDAITLDLFICDLNYLGKGLSAQMIQEFLISQFSNKKEVLIDPEATNTRAIHVYEKAGFRIIGEFIAKWHPVPHYKMRLDLKQLIEK
jgi:RimJ/RimL family protein N-acetyltransferase